MEKTSLQNQVWSSVHLAPTWPAEQRYNTGLNTFKTFSYSLTFKNMRSFKNTFLCRKRMFSRTSLTPRKLDWENNKIFHQNKTRTYKSCVNNRHSYNNICEHEYISDSDTWLLRPSTLQLSTWGQKCPKNDQMASQKLHFCSIQKDHGVNLHHNSHTWKRPCFSKKGPGGGWTIGLGQLSQGVDESPIKCGHFVTSNVGLRKAPRGRPSVLATRF